MAKLVRVGRALASRVLASRKGSAGKGDDETVLPTPSHEECRMIVSLSIICLIVSIIVVAIADEIERRSLVNVDGIDNSAENVTENRAVEKNPIGETRAISHRNSNSPSANSNHHNDEQSTLQELDELVNDIVNSSARMQKEVVREKSVEYDNFLKLINS